MAPDEDCPADAEPVSVSVWMRRGNGWLTRCKRGLCRWAGEPSDRALRMWKPSTRTRRSSWSMNTGPPTDSEDSVSIEIRCGRTGALELTKSWMIPRIEAAGSACLSMYCNVIERAIKGQRLSSAGQNHGKHDLLHSETIFNTYHRSIRLRSFLSSVVDNATVSISVTGWSFSNVTAPVAIAVGIAVFMRTAILCRYEVQRHWLGLYL